MASKFRKLAVGGLAASVGAGLTAYMLLKEDGGHMFVSISTKICLNDRNLGSLFFLISGTPFFKKYML